MEWWHRVSRATEIRAVQERASKGGAVTHLWADPRGQHDLLILRQLAHDGRYLLRALPGAQHYLREPRPLCAPAVHLSKVQHLRKS